MKEFLKKRKPDILTFIGLGGMVAFGIMMYRSRPAVEEALDKELEETHEPLTKRQTAWVYVRTLWPTLAIGGASAVCIVFGNREHNKRNAALATAYYISESTLKTYQEKVIEEIGEKKEKEIQAKVAEERSKKAEFRDDVVTVIEDKGPWILDTYANPPQFYRMSLEKVRRVAAEQTLNLRDYNYISVQEFYEALDVDMPENLDDFGFEHLGWNTSWCSKIEVEFDHIMREVQGEVQPVAVMRFRERPRPNCDWFSKDW